MRARRLLISVLLPVIILIGFAATAAANGSGGPAGKVEVCHFANHKFVEINISTHALPAHLAHGDVLPDQYGACP